MKIIVCLKQVPDTNEVRINQETGTLIRDGVPSIMNPDDKNALEEALKLKEEYDAKVVALSMGPNQAKDVLREALAMGADEGILLSDCAFGGSDTWATATIIAAAIEKIGDYDVVFCGRQAIDGDTAQVGPEIAEFLNIPQVTYVKDLKVKKEKLEVTRFAEFGEYIFETSTPVLLTAIKELNTPRYPTIKGIREAYTETSEEKIKVWGFEDIDVDKSQIGLKGSPTNVFKSFVPVKDKTSEIIEGKDAQEKAKVLLTKLAKRNLI